MTNAFIYFLFPFERLWSLLQSISALMKCGITNQKQRQWRINTSQQLSDHLLETCEYLLTKQWGGCDWRSLSLTKDYMRICWWWQWWLCSSLQYGEALEMLSVVPVERQFTYQFSFETKYLISNIFWATYFVEKNLCLILLVVHKILHLQSGNRTLESKICNQQRNVCFFKIQK